MKWILFILIGVIFCSCSNFDTHKKLSEEDLREYKHIEETVQVEQENTLKESDTNWEYNELINEIDDSKSYSAKIIANEELNFDFPSEGGAIVTLLICKNPFNTDVMLKIDKGQFTSKNFKDIKVRFDNDRPETFSYKEPANLSSTVIYLNNSAGFISRLKKSEQLLIQCEFFHQGMKTIKFDTKGLVWNY